MTKLIFLYDIENNPLSTNNMHVVVHLEEYLTSSWTDSLTNMQIRIILLLNSYILENFI